MIFASLGLDWANFQRGINGAMNSTRQLGNAMQQSMAGGVASGIMRAVGSLSAIDIAMKIATFSIRGFYNALEAGDNLVDLNAQTGIAVDKLMELQLAFDLNGMKAEQLQPVIAKLQRSIADAASGSDEAALKFARMGISITDIQGLTADEQLMKVGEAIKNIENPAQRSAAAMEIFGKSGAKLLSVFGSGGKDDPGGMNEVRKMLGNQSALLLENAGVFGRASDLLGLAGNKMRGFFVGIASETMPQLMEFLDRMAMLDLTKVGQSLGDGIAIAIELLSRAIDKIRPFLEMSEKLGKTQSTYGGQAFMGMGGMGGAGTALSEATVAAEKPQPKTGFFDDILADIEKKRVEARKKYATPGAGETGADIASKGVMSAAAPLITSSMSKMGAIGAAVWGGDQGINVQRDQLAVQQRIANSIDRFLQAAQPTENPYLGGVTPQLGVI